MTDDERTVARIAGAIASGLVSGFKSADVETLMNQELAVAIATISVRFARAIIAETQRTVPKEQP